ncbi:MAG TPA: bifunctional 4-hydroxy-2-oxoglutarate aldolase/2-dehydro-3-deoxy-phosphogluconate aldolase [Bryobacteraceae bacterium]
MSKAEVCRRIEERGIIAVIRAATPTLALAAANAAAEGGVSVIEITLTVPRALEAIRELSRSALHLLVGAGTVLDASAARECLEAGAEFLVSPGFDRAIVELARREGVLMMAGALTPTEILEAWRAGSDFVKIFPCGNLGGASYIQTLKAVLPQVPIIPTGGVNLQTAGPLLEAGAAALGVGGELISAAALQAGDFWRITATARQLMEILKRHRCASPLTPV